MSRDKKPSASTSSEQLSVGQWTEDKRPVRRRFPGPHKVDVLLRVAMERVAYAEVIVHAKESPDAEVCGVLVGDLCVEEDGGHFVHVQAAIRGESARESSSHVTFTQETWKNIHETLERDYHKLRIVGWYHSHPGFGVEFSEMDQFIQKNFFPSNAHIALVTDPLGGDVAICTNTDDGIAYIDKFWVQGREFTCRIPGKSSSAPIHEEGSSLQLAGQLRALETRLNQVIQTLDEQQSTFHRFLSTLLIVACLGITTLIGYSIYNQYKSTYEPPQLRSFAPIPIHVKVGDRTVMLGIAVVDWNVPPELNAVYLQLEKEKRAAERAAARKRAAGKKTETGASTK